MKRKAIYLCAGHGGVNLKLNIDKGAEYGGFYERDLTVKTMRKVEGILQDKEELRAVNILPVGIETNAWSWAKNRYINNSIKQSGWNAEDCLCIDLHFNSSIKKASGVEVWLQDRLGSDNIKKAEKKLAVTFLERGIAYYKQTNRGVKSRNIYYVDINCPMVLFEAGFMNDEKFLDYAVNDNDRLAESIANSILTFIRNN